VEIVCADAAVTQEGTASSVIDILNLILDYATLLFKNK
jgi:hypothetical protein